MAERSGNGTCNTGARDNPLAQVGSTPTLVSAVPEGQAMDRIFRYLDFVNEQATFHERKALEFKGQNRERPHRITADKLRGLAAEIESLRNATILRLKPGEDPLSLNPIDVKGLPEELLAQLVNLPDSDKLETEIVQIINEAGGTLLLDHLLIALYRRTGEVHQRSQIISKLYRMSKKRLVFSSPVKKGAYTTIPQIDSSGTFDDENHTAQAEPDQRA